MQPYGPPPPLPKKGGLPTWLMVVGGLLFAMLACGGAVCGVSVLGIGKAVQDAEEAQATEDREAAQALPWTANVSANCKRYDAAKTDYDRSLVLADNEKIINQTLVPVTRSKLESKRLSSDGSQMQFTLAVGSAKFKPSLLHPILADTHMFLKLQKLEPGACVQFSARAITAASILERSKVCDKDYFADFATIEPCP